MTLDRPRRQLPSGRCARAGSSCSRGRCRRRRALEAGRGRGNVTAAAGDALHDLCEALLSGGYDRVDKEVLVAAAAARPEVAG